MHELPFFNGPQPVRRIRMIIDRKMALEMMAMNHDNRAMIPRHLECLCGVLRRGEWQYNGDPIRFDVRPGLLDGQHRLQAVILTGISIDTDVIFGLPRETMSTVDAGRPRRTCDWLSMSGEKDTRLLAAALLWQTLYDMRSLSGKGPVPFSTLEQALAQHPQIRDGVAWVNHHRAIKQIVAPSIPAWTYYAFGHDPVLRERFFNGLIDGADLSIGNPILTLRERLRKNRSEGHRGLRYSYIVAFFIKAWNAARNGQTLRLLKWTEDSDCPVIQ